MIKPVATGLAGRSPRAGVLAAGLGSGKLTAPLSISWDEAPDGRSLYRVQS